MVPGAAKDVLFTTWVYLELDDVYWKQLIKYLGTHPSTCNDAEPNLRSMPPPRLSQRSAASSTPPRRQSPHNSPPPFRARDSHFAPTPPRRNGPQPSLRRELSPRREKSPIRTQKESKNYDPRKLGQNKKNSLGILNLLISTAAKER